MKISYKSISVFLSIVVVVLLAVVVARLPHSSSAPPTPTPRVITTPEQDQHIQAFTNYLEQLKKDELVVVKEIGFTGSDPFILILKPNNSQEITDEDVQDVSDLVTRAASIFESRGGLHHDDISITFHRPAGQNIIFIKRQTVPDLLGADEFGEMTMAVDQRYFTSLVNLAGPPKNGRQDFANAWFTIQAVCLAYSGDFVDSDPVCNIISANAAAAWAGMGIYHYGARFYSPKLGRFISADSIVPGYSNPQAFNRYSYVLNNPLRYTDPTGHMQSCEDGDDCGRGSGKSGGGKSNRNRDGCRRRCAADDDGLIARPPAIVPSASGSGASATSTLGHKSVFG